MFESQNIGMKPLINSMPDFLGQTPIVGGQAIVNVGHNTSGIVWQVEQITAQTNKVSSAATAFIKKNGVTVAPSAALTPLDVGQATTAGGLPYVYLAASDQLSVQVQGAAAGDVLTVRAQYREFHDTDPGMSGR